MLATALLSFASLDWALRLRFLDSMVCSRSLEELESIDLCRNSNCLLPPESMPRNSMAFGDTIGDSGFAVGFESNKFRLDALLAEGILARWRFSAEHGSCAILPKCEMALLGNEGFKCKDFDSSVFRLLEAAGVLIYRRKEAHSSITPGDVLLGTVVLGAASLVKTEVCPGFRISFRSVSGEATEMTLLETQAELASFESLVSR